jgi:uncharacterized protein (DUF924 family)
MARWDEIIEFWFDPNLTPAERGRRWFAGGADFDRLCRASFLPDYERAMRGDLDDWSSDAAGCLALVLLLDQLPRNMFRNSPRAYAGDTQAREVCRRAIDHGFYRRLPPVQRVFLYLPLEHSEQPADQQDSVRLQHQLAEEDPACAGFVQYAEEHLTTIARFGRFPQRNAILGRPSTPEEIAFLQEIDDD